MTSKKVLATLAATVALAVPGTASADVVTDWNRTLVDALLVARTAPQPGTRIGAIVQTSVFDAVNGITRRYTQFHPEVLPPDAPRGASAPAAAAGAAYTALVTLFPAQKATFDNQLAATVATLSDDGEGGTSTAVARGLEWGTAVAEAILAWRASDDVTGALLPAYVQLPLPFWQPPGSPPCITPAARQFATMTPWSMTSPSAFLPAPPPALSSARYAQDFDEVKTIGTAATTPDLADEAATARFWAARFDSPATMWNRVGESLAMNRDVPLVYNARLFALLNVALADAVIGVYNAKNFYEAWRPVTAIQNADIDGNDATIADPSWLPLLTTPCHQEYPSGHSGLSTAATTVLAAFFGNDTTFTVSSDALVSGGTRTYSSFSEAIDEIALARVAAGIHFRFACEVARQMGQGISEYALAHEMLFRGGSP
jgi:membrane-associated phospholipid phosphatase